MANAVTLSVDGDPLVLRPFSGMYCRACGSGAVGLRSFFLAGSVCVSRGV